MCQGSERKKSLHTKRPHRHSVDEHRSATRGSPVSLAGPGMGNGVPWVGDDPFQPENLRSALAGI